MPTTTKRDRHGFRGTPALPRFSLAEVPDDALLRIKDIAAFLQLAISTVSEWPQQDDSKIDWVKLPNGAVRGTAGSLRRLIAASARRQKKGAEREAAAAGTP